MEIYALSACINYCGLCLYARKIVVDMTVCVSSNALEVCTIVFFFIPFVTKHTLTAMQTGISMNTVNFNVSERREESSETNNNKKPTISMRERDREREREKNKIEVKRSNYGF